MGKTKTNHEETKREKEIAVKVGEDTGGRRKRRKGVMLTGWWGC